MGWEEREARRQARFERRTRRWGVNASGRTPNISWLGGAILVAIGSILFLDNLGWVSAGHVWSTFWPMAVIAFGVWKLTNPCRNSDRLLGGLSVAFGIFFLLAALDILHVRLHDGSWSIAVLMIVAGILALNKSLERGSPVRPPQSQPQQNSPPSPGSPPSRPTPEFRSNEPTYLDDWVFAGSKKRRVDATDFRGGEIHCVLGEVNLDLRNAYQPRPDRPMVLEAHCVLGAVRLRVPQDWVVQLEGSSVFGNFQDKTLPVQGVNGRAPTLVVTGGVFFGEVVVDS